MDQKLEMWLYRRILKIGWTNRNTNQSVGKDGKRKGAFNNHK